MRGRFLKLRGGHAGRAHRTLRQARPFVLRTAIWSLTVLCAVPAPTAASPAVPPDGAAGTPALGTAAAAGSAVLVQQVHVVAVAPLPGAGLDRGLLPYSTQVLSAAAIERAQTDTLADLLNRRLPGVQVNDLQGSPFQVDLTYRGYRASALLGAGQGLSVVLDGVRLNEPFGDVIAWDGVPEFALQAVSLVPGANPAFGLNALGGALSLTTHDGRSAPGWRMDAGAGSHGRRRIDLSHGASSVEGWHRYVAASLFDEDGWRDHSDGRLGRLFAKIGREGARTDWDLGLLLGRSRLVGNGLVPAQTLEVGDDGSLDRSPHLYAARREAVYTHPDLTRHRLAQLALNLRHRIDDASELSALLYARASRRDTVNGDAAEQADEPGAAALNTTATRQRAVGGALRWAGRHGAHQWQLGATLEASRSRYAQFEQEGVFTADRGVQAGDEAEELSARLHGSSLAAGVYGSDTWTLGPRTHLTATLRVNHARVANSLTSVDDDTGEVRERPRERFRYDSVNPALGLTQRLGAGGATAFANLARNNRVPTAIELGCADPAEPCRLPAGLQSDPYLKQVVARTAELGLRGPLRPGWQATLAAWRTDNRDDILFRSVSPGGQRGYFANFPRTRHQGVDLDLQGRAGAWELSLAASWLRATYEADGLLRQGERNVVITPGTPIAGLARRQLKLSIDGPLTPGLGVGVDLQAVSSRGVMGNEDGRLEDGEDPAARLRLPGHALLHLRARWQAGGGWEWVARVNNVFDRRHENFGALAETVFDARGVPAAQGREALFVAPGAPRSVFVGLRWRH